MLRALAKTVKVLNSDADPLQIALALSLSLVAGLTPLSSLHNIAVLFLVLVLRVNLSSFLLGLMVFGGMAYALDPLFHAVGLKALRAEALQGLWTAMYNSTLWRLERFNNTVLMGSLLVSLALFVPVFILSRFAVLRYRERALVWIRKTRLVRMLKASKFYNLYQSAKGWGLME